MASRIRQSTYEEARARTDKIRAGFEEINRLSAFLPRGRKAAADQRSVYFIQAANGLIKIGVAGNPRDRMKTLRTMPPVSLRLALVLPGLGASGEAELHERFAAHRSHGEWFRPAAEIIDYIQGRA